MQLSDLASTPKKAELIAKIAKEDVLESSGS